MYGMCSYCGSGNISERSVYDRYDCYDCGYDSDDDINVFHFHKGEIEKAWEAADN